jgi:hypothetical protein
MIDANIRGKFYYWEDPDGGVCSKVVIGVGVVGELLLCVDEHGYDLVVMPEELTRLPSNKLPKLVASYVAEEAAKQLKKLGVDCLTTEVLEDVGFGDDSETEFEFAQSVDIQGTLIGLVNELLTPQEQSTVLGRLLRLKHGTKDET